MGRSLLRASKRISTAFHTLFDGTGSTLAVPTSTKRPAPVPFKYLRLAVPALGVLGIALISVGLAAAGGSYPRIDLEGFRLPEDSMLSTLLLDSLAMEELEPDEASIPPALPMTLSMASYKVARNETLDSIARRYGIRLDTLISVNGIGDVRRIPAGYSLKVPNIDGVVHTVRKGESISGIASRAGVSILDIIDANDLSSQTILPGQSLFIPGGRLSSYDLKKALGQLVIWPVSGNISSYFGYRPSPFYGTRQFHSGIDIVAPENTSAKAAMDGRVAETGYSALFGNYVILSHDGGYQTLYAHLNSIKASRGARIQQGDKVGLIGSTGYSTGVHLHFGVYKNGKAMDPLKLLKGR
jgi:murein DD-endopeptidase MepM/ murein hydrolase activator NlpD